MKGITNKSLAEDKKIIANLLEKYNAAIWESQEGQVSHFDNQPKLVKLAVGDVRAGLNVAYEALRMLNELEVIEEN